MLRTLTRLLRRGSDPAQITLDFAPSPANAEELLERLRELGLYGIQRCRLTHNRNVMVSFGGGELRIHEAYLVAPENVLRAIVRFVSARTRVQRREAQRVIVGFPVQATRAPVRRERTQPHDVAMRDEFVRHHAELNALHFGGVLTAVEIRVSRRMKSRLGHYTARGHGYPAEIAVSWRHVRRHGWREAKETLLHEMVHQWQDETGLSIDHGATFRSKAREVGIVPMARRELLGKSGAGPRLVAGSPSYEPPAAGQFTSNAGHNGYQVAR